MCSRSKLPVAGVLLALLSLVNARDAGLHDTQADHGERQIIEVSYEQEDLLATALDLLQKHGSAPAGSTQEGKTGAVKVEVEEVSSVLEEALAERPLCTPDHFPQLEHLRGQWRPHADPKYQGLYDANAKCAAHIEKRHQKDWSCHGNAEGPLEKELWQKEVAQEYHPDVCELRPFSSEGMAECMKDRRLIMIGDSVMTQQYFSLSCLLAEEIKESETHHWDDYKRYPVQGDYWKHWAPGYNFSVHKQIVGDFTTRTGLKVSLRTSSHIQEQLWDDVMAEFLPLQPNDIVMVNFAAWYPRFKWQEKEVPWERWQADMTWLIEQRLSTYPCKVLLKEYAPSHFGGSTGTFTGIEESLPGVPAKGTCFPAIVGEYWYDEWLRAKLQECGEACSHVHMLPIFHASLPRANSHIGSFGRGRTEKQIDCRHFCQNVVDPWNVILYNKECPL